MKDKCPFRKAGHCDIWIDYQILQYSLQEAEELASANWNEIRHLYDRVNQLESVLRDAGITIPEEK